MIRGKTTNTLKNTIKTYCKDDEHANFLCNVLDETLKLYQWHYQVADGNRAYRDIRNQYLAHIKTTIHLLQSIGQLNLAKDVQDALYNDDKTSIYTKSKILSQAKKHMKNHFLAKKMPSSTYDKGLAYNMEYLFEEWCKTYPLEEAPAHFDDDFYT